MRLLVFCLIGCFAAACLAQDEVKQNYLMGKFKPNTDKRFKEIGGYFLRKETVDAFQKMRIEAGKNNVNLQIVSATRTFAQQKQIWESKWKGEMPVNTDTAEFLPKPNSPQDNLTKKQRALRILEFSSMPSASRHHWGTDFDLNNVNPSYWETKKGKKEYAWLSENAPSFGFCQVYSANRPIGYKEEKWHWSFLPLAKQFTDEYQRLFTDSDITLTDFLGSETAITTDFIKNYVLGIDPNCR